MNKARHLLHNYLSSLSFVAQLLFLVCGIGGNLAAQESAFTVALIPDTQVYSQSYPATYSAQTQWIKDNAAADNIKFAIHLGDIVNSPTDTAQWQNASNAQAILDGHVPNSVLPGNHDVVNPYDPATRTSVQYNQYFGPQRYEGNAWYGGHEGTTNNNNYCYFEGGDMVDASDNIVFSAHTAAGGNLVHMGSGEQGGFYLNPTDIGGTTPNEEFGTGLNDGQWKFVAVTLAGDGTTTVRYYTEGNIAEIVGFTDRAGYPTWTAADLFNIGQEWDSTAATNFFDGLIDDMRIYDTVLTQYQLEEIYLSAIPEPDPIPGDANGDGYVDVSDLGILATNYDAGGGFEWGDADFTGDGLVDVSDLGILATAYGNTAGTAAVPEPGTLTLLALGGLTLLGLGARRRKR